MIHISYAIAQFFEIMLSAILRTAGGVIAICLSAMLGVGVLISIARRMRRPR